MKGELQHAQHPRHTYIRWAIFYVVFVAVAVGAFFVVANRIRTYSIPSGALQLSVPYKKYVVGESISFTLKNNYNSTVYVEDDCPEEPLAVFMRQGDDWVRVHDKATAASCSGKERQIAIAPYGQRTANFDAWPHLFEKPGTYRVVADVEYFNTASYQDFEVIAKPEKKVVAAPTTSTITQTTTPSTTSITQNTSTTQTTVTNTTPTSTPTVTTSTKTISSGGNSITVSYTSTSFTITAVTPKSGCTVEGKKAGFTGTSSETTFKCGGTETQIQLSISGGVLHSKIE